MPLFLGGRCVTIVEVRREVGDLLGDLPTQWTTFRVESTGAIILLVQPVGGLLQFAFTFEDQCLARTEAMPSNTPP